MARAFYIVRRQGGGFVGAREVCTVCAWILVRKESPSILRTLRSAGGNLIYEPAACLGSRTVCERKNTQVDRGRFRNGLR